MDIPSHFSLRCLSPDDRIRVVRVTVRRRPEHDLHVHDHVDIDGALPFRPTRRVRPRVVGGDVVLTTTKMRRKQRARGNARINGPSESLKRLKTTPDGPGFAKPSVAQFVSVAHPRDRTDSVALNETFMEHTLYRRSLRVSAPSRTNSLYDDSPVSL